MRLRGWWIIAGLLIVIAIFALVVVSFERQNRPQGIIENFSEQSKNASESTAGQEGEIIQEINMTCGYCQYLVNDSCLNYSCCNDSQCPTDKICIEHECESPNCTACQYAENHECVNYECCEDEDCEEGRVCGFNKCIGKENLTIPYDVPFEILVQTGSHGPYIMSYEIPDSIPHLVIPVDYSAGGEGSTMLFAIMRNKGEFDYLDNTTLRLITATGIIYDGLGYDGQLIDFNKYFVVLLSGSLEGTDYVFVTKEIKASSDNITIYFDRLSSGREMTNDAESLIMINKSDLIKRNNIDFIFLARGESGLSWTIPNVTIP